MDTARDLTRADPWLESLERSLTRRGKARRSSTEQKRVRSGAALVAAKGFAALAALAALLASVLGGGSQGSPNAARAVVSRAATIRPSADPPSAASGSGGVGLGGTGSCQLASSPTGYADPLAGAAVRPERIDQGVDYAGSGTLSSIGAGTVTYLATTGTGWPGTFIEYQLLGGADAGCYVYYAEGVTPVPGLHVGETVSAGEAIATIIPRYPTGIEIGWGAGNGTKAYAAAVGQWSAGDDQENVASAAGRSFSALIASLGGPPGRVEG